MSANASAPFEQKESFTYNGIPVVAQDQKKAERILDSLSKIGVGKYSLKKLAEYQTEICFSDTLGERAIGCYCDDINKIVLSTAFSEACLKTTLVHEATHAVQHRNGASELKNENLNAASRLLLDRCLEADAQCASLEAAHQFSRRGDKAPLEAFTLDAPQMVRAFDREKSYTDAYKAWFDDRYVVEAYERAYIGENVIRSMKVRDVSNESPEIASASRLERICGLYCDDFKEFVRKDKRASMLHPLTKAFLELKNAANIAKGAEADISVKSLPVAENRNAADSAKMFSEMQQFLKTSRYKDSGNGLMYLSLQRTIDSLAKNASKDGTEPSGYDNRREKIFMYMATALEKGAPKSILKCSSAMPQEDRQLLQLHAHKMRAPSRDLTDEETRMHRRNLDRLAGEIKINPLIMQHGNTFGGKGK